MNSLNVLTRHLPVDPAGIHVLVYLRTLARTSTSVRYEAVNRRYSPNPKRPNRPEAAMESAAFTRDRYQEDKVAATTYPAAIHPTHPE